MNQQIVTFDERRFLVETVERQIVTELLDHERGTEVTGLLAAEAIALAEQIQADRHIPAWPQTDLAAALCARFELEVETNDPMARAAIAFTVQELLTDPDLAEWLYRMQTGGMAA